MDEYFPGEFPCPGLAAIVDVFDSVDLFEPLDNHRIVELSGLGSGTGFSSPENVLRATGVESRRILKPGVEAIDVALEVCRRLENRSGIQMRDFPAVFLCHSHTNSVACQILADQICEHTGLARSRVSAFNFGCSGFLKLLQEAWLTLMADDSLSRIVLMNVETPEFWHDASDRLFCGIVAAGGTAIVLDRSAGLPLKLVRSDDFPVAEENRRNGEPLFVQEDADGFCFRGNAIRRRVMRMNAEPVFLNGIELMLSGLRNAAVALNTGDDRRVIVIPHQPSGKLLKALIAAARKEFPTFEFINNLRTYGNTISCSVPTILCRLPEVLRHNDMAPLRDGDQIVLLAAGICMERISDHMSAGYACVEWVDSPLAASISEFRSDPVLEISG